MPRTKQTTRTSTTGFARRETADSPAVVIEFKTNLSSDSVSRIEEIIDEWDTEFENVSSNGGPLRFRLAHDIYKDINWNIRLANILNEITDSEEGNVEGEVDIPLKGGEDRIDFGLYLREDGTREIEIYHVKEDGNTVYTEQYIRKNIQ